MGDSIGRWEGDTLVIDVTGFSDDTWLADNGAFHTRDLRVTERLRKVGDRLEWRRWRKMVPCWPSRSSSRNGSRMVVCFTIHRARTPTRLSQRRC